MILEALPVAGRGTVDVEAAYAERALAATLVAANSCSLSHLRPGHDAYCGFVSELRVADLCIERARAVRGSAAARLPTRTQAARPV